jgi:hypothetical protein
MALRQGAVDHHGCLGRHPGSLRRFSDKIPCRRDNYVIDRPTGVRSHMNHTRRMRSVALHRPGVDAGFRQLATQIATMNVAPHARTERDRNGT